jgi:hypothetical protein
VGPLGTEGLYANEVQGRRSFWQLSSPVHVECRVSKASFPMVRNRS